MPGLASSSDPYIMPELPGYPSGNQNYSGRTQVDALPLGANTAVIVLFGDSLSSNTVDTVFVPVEALNQNFNIYNGGLYTSAEPLLGCQTNSADPTSGCFFTRVADSLITGSVYTRVIIVPIAVGGSLFADWASTGAVNGRFAVTAARLTAAGLPPTAVYCMLGANDSNAGVTQAAATNSLVDIISTIRTLWTCPVFVARHSIFGLVASSAVQAAQNAVLDTPNRIYTGGDMDSLTAGGNYWDNTHFNATGAAAAAALAVAAITAHP